MPANRATRDELIIGALRMADVPSLNKIDVTGNIYTGAVTVNPGAISIGWLQSYIDLFAGRFPWAQNMNAANISYSKGLSQVLLPLDFILDKRDGLTVTVDGRTRQLRRRGFQNILNIGLNTPPGAPAHYCIQGPNVLVTPTPDKAYTGQLFYYYLPAFLGPTDIPYFPSDLTLIECIRIRAMEWIRAAPPGSSLAYAERQIVEMRKSGLHYDPENEDVPFDTHTFIPGAGGDDTAPWGWMGGF